MAVSKRRKRHKGVVLMRPNAKGRTGWRARYLDPEAPPGVKKYKWESLPAELTTAEQREAWAVAKARSLEKRRMEIDSGAPRATGTALAEAVGKYYKAHPQLRPRTIEVYKAATDRMLAWADEARVRSADDLGRAQLGELRAAIVAAPKRVAVEGGTRGEREASGERRSPAAANKDLRAIRAVLGYLCSVDLLPKLTDGDLKRGLKQEQIAEEHIEFLKPSALRKLIDAALRHDAATYTETREEHGGRAIVGTTPRYESVAPFVCGVLLTGMRLDEALSLTWDQVDLDALDSTGRKVGEIHLKGSGTKTKKARTIGLEVSPALRELLAALKLKTGGAGSVFGLSRGVVDTAMKRLRDEYGAPKNFTYQVLRRTCGTYLTNAPGIYGAASAYHSARQLGHSTAIAEKYYLGRERGIPRDAHDLETAMQIGEHVKRVVAKVGRPHENRRLAAIA